MMSVFVLLMSLMGTITALNQCTDLGELTTVQQGRRLMRYTFLSLDLKGVMHCAQACLNRKRCKSFNIKTGLGNCELNLNTSSETGTLASDPEYIYSDIDQWTQQVMKECISHTCSYAQMCQSSHPVLCQECSNASECGVCYPITEVSGRQFRSYGCFHSSPRVLPNLIVNLRVSPGVQWTSMTDTILDCANAAVNTGYDFFGIEFYGECYGGDMTEVTVDRPVSVADCADNCWAGAGGGGVMFVYQWI